MASNGALTLKDPWLVEHSYAKNPTLCASYTLISNYPSPQKLATSHFSQPTAHSAFCSQLFTIGAYGLQLALMRSIQDIYRKNRCQIQPAKIVEYLGAVNNPRIRDVIGTLMLSTPQTRQNAYRILSVICNRRYCIGNSIAAKQPNINPQLLPVSQTSTLPMSSIPGNISHNPFKRRQTAHQSLNCTYPVRYARHPVPPSQTMPSNNRIFSKNNIHPSQQPVFQSIPVSSQLNLSKKSQTKTMQIPILNLCERFDKSQTQNSTVNRTMKSNTILTIFSGRHPPITHAQTQRRGCSPGQIDKQKEPRNAYTERIHLTKASKVQDSQIKYPSRGINPQITFNKTHEQLSLSRSMVNLRNQHPSHPQTKQGKIQRLKPNSVSYQINRISSKTGTITWNQSLGNGSKLAPSMSVSNKSGVNLQNMMTDDKACSQGNGEILGMPNQTRGGSKSVYAPSNNSIADLFSMSPPQMTKSILSFNPQLSDSPPPATHQNKRVIESSPQFLQKSPSYLNKERQLQSYQYEEHPPQSHQDIKHQAQPFEEKERQLQSYQYEDYECKNAMREYINPGFQMIANRGVTEQKQQVQKQSDDSFQRSTGQALNTDNSAEFKQPEFPTKPTQIPSAPTQIPSEPTQIPFPKRAKTELNSQAIINQQPKDNNNDSNYLQSENYDNSKQPFNRYFPGSDIAVAQEYRIQTENQQLGPGSPNTNAQQKIVQNQFQDQDQAAYLDGPQSKPSVVHHLPDEQSQSENYLTITDNQFKQQGASGETFNDNPNRQNAQQQRNEKHPASPSTTSAVMQTAENNDLAEIRGINCQQNCQQQNVASLICISPTTKNFFNRNRQNSTIVEVNEQTPHESEASDNEDQAEIEYVIEEYETGSRYEGFKRNGVRNGRGKFYYQDGGYYDGEWRNNQMHGWGKLFYEGDKLAYEGNWANDEFHGYGKVYNDCPVDRKEAFDFSNFDLLDDYWEYYQGMLANDTKEGRGRIQLTNGEVFEGDFQMDRIQGFGNFLRNDGTVVQGIWRESKLIKIINSN